ncbi:MAG: D-alanyl-D-alanine carboxypeptidase family protein [Gemmatimonadota bacterium]|nr:D-alanyl-D-alanine carboxypeptidase family protein [Gemmatimonadota bacterium]
MKTYSRVFRLAMLSAFCLLLLPACRSGAAPGAAVLTAGAPSVNTEDLPVMTNAGAETLLVDVRAAAPEILVGLRYATSDNFTGAPLPGYEGNHAYLRREAASALARVARRAGREGYAVYVFDAYRPVRATDAMVAWTERVGRQDLITNGYIASRSRHNLGLAIDLTIVDARSGSPLDMGTPFDTFSPAAHTAHAAGTTLENRLRLKRLMESEGFLNYDQEWWHYSFSAPNPVRFDRVIH